MIITRSWLGKFIDLSQFSTESICKKLNSIGLEVDSVKSFNVPQKIVVGQITECQRHPNADKLQVCKVDIGTTERTIVCGAKNARKGIFVAVAVIGAKLPNGLEIKPVKLREVDSDGMLCSSEEIGLPKLNDGIIELDSSIGKLVKGKELRSYPLFNDDVIEIELTANRGDCLSIYGVARELSTAFEKPLKKISPVEDDSKRGIGIARVLNVDFEQNLDSSLMYKVADFENHHNMPLIIDMLLLYIDKKTGLFFDDLSNFIIHTIGVIVKMYDLEKLEKIKETYTLRIKKDENGLDSVFNNNKKVSTIGISREDEEIVSTKVVIESSYIRPDILSIAVTENNLKTDELYYNTSRGSEPNLSFGMDYIDEVLSKYFDGITIYTGEYENLNEEKQITIATDINKISKIIGQDIDSNSVLKILKSLGFKTNIRGSGENVATIVPSFRHDIANIQDITEEVVRIIGIDNIKSTPIEFYEKPKINEEYNRYKNKLDIRSKAVSMGFYENISFVFTNGDELTKYGFETLDPRLSLLNPISSELDTLRSTISINLLNSVSNNFKNGYKRVALFEIGSVFSRLRDEQEKISFVYSGLSENLCLGNNGKSDDIDFFGFANKISAIIGDIELLPLDSVSNKLMHPYASAKVIQKDIEIGYMSKLHIKVQKDFDLPDTFICELDFDKIDFGKKSAEDISKFPMVTKDLSFVVPKSMRYLDIKNSLKSIDDRIVKFFPLDVYSSEELCENISLTIRFNIQSKEGTLKDKDINFIIDKVIYKLKNDLSLELR
jgi:phenylalanyl-tRNA synthetase beta chain